MDSFYFIILAIAVVVLILVLAVIGWMMTKNVESQTFPGITTSCPDFWTVSTDAVTGKTQCMRPIANKMNRGLPTLDNDMSNKELTPGGSSTSFDPNDPGWSKSGNSVCGKKKWATTYGENWDTVVNSSIAC